MRTTFVSTASLMGTPRSGIGRMQSDLVRLNQEVVTSRMADVGLNLGAQTSRSVSLHVDTSALASLATSDAAITTRLQTTQTALDTMRTGASDFLHSLLDAKTSGGTTSIAQTARLALSTFTSAANTSDGRNYLFGGINSGTAPIAQYDAGPGAAVDAAFLAKFGFAQDDPATANIDGATMSDFLDNQFAQLFSDPDWGTTWSSASDQTITSRITPTETATTSVSANEPAMRKLAEVYTMLGNLGFEGLGADARQAVLNKAIDLIGSASDGIIAIQADVGGVQAQVSSATDRVKAQQAIVEERIGTLEGVDPAEAKVKIDTLTTQIQMSYSLTAKLLQISILNYA